MKRITFVLGISISLVLVNYSCNNSDQNQNNITTEDSTISKRLTIQDRLNQYATFSLTSDMSQYSENEKEMIGYLIDACKVIDDIFWLQAYGNKDTLFSKLKTDEEKEFCKINYGPWDRLNDNERENWVLNDESLYTWARGEGVRI